MFGVLDQAGGGTGQENQRRPVLRVLHQEIGENPRRGAELALLELLQRFLVATLQNRPIALAFLEELVKSDRLDDVDDAHLAELAREELRTNLFLRTFGDEQ